MNYVAYFHSVVMLEFAQPARAVTLLIQIWIRATGFGMQAFWYYLAWAPPRAIKAALLSMSSAPLNFGNPVDSLTFRRMIVFLCSCVVQFPRRPSAALLSKRYSQQSSQFCQAGVFLVIMNTCGCRNLVCLQHILGSHKEVNTCCISEHAGS